MLFNSMNGSRVIIPQILLFPAKFLLPCARALCWSALTNQGWGEIFPWSRRSVLKAVANHSKSPLTCCSVEFEHASHVLLTISHLKPLLRSTLIPGPCVVWLLLVVRRVYGDVSQPVASWQQTETAAVATALSGLDSSYGNPPTG